MRGPFSFVPTPANNPFARWCVADSLLDQGHGFVCISYIFEVQSQQALTQREQMNMRIYQSRQDRGTVQIDDLRCVVKTSPRLGRGSDPGNAISLNCDCLGRGPV